MKMAGMIRVWDEDWKRRGEMKMEERLVKRSTSSCREDFHTSEWDLRNTKNNREDLTKKNSIVTELIHMGLIPIVFAGGKPKEETPLNGCGVGILEGIPLNTRMQVTGKKLEARVRNLRRNEQNMLNLLQDVRQGHTKLETWHLMGMGMNSLS